MDDKTFFETIAPLGWGTPSTDYKAMKRRLMSELTPERAEELSRAFETIKGRVAAAISDKLDGQLSDDRFDDLCAHIVGLGEATVEAVLAKPRRAVTLAAGDIPESFAYVFPSRDDFAMMTVDHYVERAIEIEILYRTAAAAKAGITEARVEPIVTAMKLLALGDVDGCLKVEEEVRQLAKTIADEARAAAVKAASAFGMQVMFNGDSVTNHWIVWNLYSDLRTYLRPAS